MKNSSWFQLSLSGVFTAWPCSEGGSRLCMELTLMVQENQVLTIGLVGQECKRLTMKNLATKGGLRKSSRQRRCL
jgi:hypothetical protein